MRTFRIANAMNVLISMIGISVWLVWPLMLGGLWDYDPLHIGLGDDADPVIGGIDLRGLREVVPVATATAASLIFGGSIIIVANGWFLTHTTIEPDYWWSMFPGLVLMGIGMGCTFAPLNAAALVDLTHRSPVGQRHVQHGSLPLRCDRHRARGRDAGRTVDNRPAGAVRAGIHLLLGLSAVALVSLVVAWPRRAAVDEGD